MVIAAAEDRVRSRQNRRAIGRSTGALLRPPVLPDRSRCYHGVGWRPRRHHRGRKWNTCDQAGRVLGRLARSENHSRRGAEDRREPRRVLQQTVCSANFTECRPPRLSPALRSSALVSVVETRCCNRRCRYGWPWTLAGTVRSPASCWFTRLPLGRIGDRVAARRDSVPARSPSPSALSRPDLSRFAGEVTGRG